MFVDVFICFSALSCPTDVLYSSLFSLLSPVNKLKTTITVSERHTLIQLNRLNYVMDSHIREIAGWYKKRKNYEE